jgi:hypothetical protein
MPAFTPYIKRKIHLRFFFRDLKDYKTIPCMKLELEI